MKIEILRPVMISGEPASAGSFVEVNIADANLLIGMGKARKAEAQEPKPEPKPEPEAKPEPEVKPKRTRSTAPKE